MCEMASLQMRRLNEEQSVPIWAAQPLPPSDSKASKAEATDMTQTTSANAASSSNTQDAGADPWKNIQLPCIADMSEQQVMDPKTLLECCQCAKACNQEHELADRGAIRSLHPSYP